MRAEIKITNPDQSVLEVNIAVCRERYIPVIQAIFANKGNVSRSIAARLAGVCPSWFSHEFSMLFGMSFRSALVRSKMYLTALLLLNTGLRISEIAFWLGYAEVKKFGAAFKVQFGMSPSVYRTVIHDATVPLRNSAGVVRG
jgi:AraC-like DNA-binding protein